MIFQKIIITIIKFYHISRLLKMNNTRTDYDKVHAIDWSLFEVFPDF